MKDDLDHSKDPFCRACRQLIKSNGRDEDSPTWTVDGSHPTRCVCKEAFHYDCARKLKQCPKCGKPWWNRTPCGSACPPTPNHYECANCMNPAKQDCKGAKA